MKLLKRDFNSAQCLKASLAQRKVKSSSRIEIYLFFFFSINYLRFFLELKMFFNRPIRNIKIIKVSKISLWAFIRICYTTPLESTKSSENQLECRTVKVGKCFEDFSTRAYCRVREILVTVKSPLFCLYCLTTTSAHVFERKKKEKTT